MTYPTDQEIRTALIARIDEYCRLTGVPKSTVGKLALNDSAFVLRLTTERNFTIDVYRRLMTWLDENWPSAIAGESAETVPAQVTP